jgi:hypothetical protein
MVESTHYTKHVGDADGDEIEIGQSPTNCVSSFTAAARRTLGTLWEWRFTLLGTACVI